MARIKETLKVLALASLLLLLWGLGYEAIRLRPTLETTLRDTHTTVLEIGLTASNLRKASLEWEKASKAQAEQSTKLLKDSTKVLTRASLLVSHLDTELNQNLIPSISTAVENQDSALLSSQLKLSSNLDAMLLATQALQKTLVDADAQISSPDIKIALDNLAETTKNASAATAEGAATMAKVHEAVNYEVAELEKPVKKIKVVWDFTLRSIGKFFGY